MQKNEHEYMKRMSTEMTLQSIVDFVQKAEKAAFNKWRCHFYLMPKVASKKWGTTRAYDKYIQISNKIQVTLQNR